jgi:hypothetical protein
VKPLFLTVKNLLMVVNPPLPRHVFTPCCNDRNHSTNLGDEGFRSSFLESIFHFRKILKTSLVGLENIGRFWVTDTLGCVGNIPPTTTEKLAALKPVLGKYGVHLTDQGCFNFFNTLAKAVLGLRNGPLVSGKKVLLERVHLRPWFHCEAGQQGRYQGTRHLHARRLWWWEGQRKPSHLLSS